MIPYIICTTIYLAAHTMHMDTIFHCEINAEVIILVASDTTVARTETYSLDWFQSAEPSEYIYIMYVLLYDMESHFQFTQSLIIYSQSFHPG